MRVLFSIDTLNVGGAEQSLLAIAGRMRRYEPVFMSLHRDRALLDHLEPLPFRCLSLDDDRFATGVRSQRIRSVVASTRPDLVLATLFHAEVATRMALGRSVPIIGTFVNDSYSDVRYRALSARQRLKLDVVRAIDAATAPICTGFLAISKTVAASNAEALGLDPARIRVVYRGRDATRYRPLEHDERARARASLGWAPDDLVILNVARMIDRKGQEELVRAMPTVRQRHPKARLVLVGDGPSRRSLEDLVASIGAGGAVTFAGTRGDVPMLLGACDVFAFPSHYEGHGGALVEAMMAGCAIVASDTPVHRESVAHLETAMLARCADANAQADALVAMLDDPGRARALGRAARAAAVERFDLDVIARAHEDYFDEVLARGAA